MLGEMRRVAEQCDKRDEDQMWTGLGWEKGGEVICDGQEEGRGEDTLEEMRE